MSRLQQENCCAIVAAENKLVADSFKLSRFPSTKFA